MRAMRERVLAWFDEGLRVAIARVIETRGSSPCPAGTVMAVNERGAISGSIGVDCVENAVAQLAQKALRDRRAYETAFDAAGDDLGGIALPCGGAIRIRVEEFCADAVETAFTAAAQTQLIVAGANDYGRALSEFCRLLNYDVILVDPRPAFSSPGVVTAWPDEFIRQTAIDDTTAIVLLSHDTRFDTPFLLHALSSQAFYVGAIGSRRTQERRRRRLSESGVQESELARLHAPVGLDIGGQTPHETALSILAEIVAVRNGKDVPALKDSAGPIHGRRPQTASAPQ